MFHWDSTQVAQCLVYTLVTEIQNYFSSILNPVYFPRAWSDRLDATQMQQ